MRDHRGYDCDYFDDLPEDTQEIVKHWIADNFHPIKSINHFHGAHSLKGVLMKEENIYLRRGCFADAMSHCGYKVLKSGDSYMFNIGQKSPLFIRKKNRYL